MKKILVITALGFACGLAQAQSADVTQSSQTSSAAQAGSVAIGGGQGTASINSNIGGSRSISQGGAGGLGGTGGTGGAGGRGGNGQGGAANSAVTVNLGSTSGDPSGGTGANAGQSANAQQVPSGSSSGTVHERITTVGNPGAQSYGVSFSQYNCANTAGVGAGFMGGAFQIGMGKESDPCNARANAAALFSIAQTLATTNSQLSAQLYHAAILLIGNSTGATKDALAAAGVSDWAPVAATTPTPAIVPPVVAPEPESKAKIAPPPVAVLPVSPAAQAAAAVVPVAPPAPEPVAPATVSVAESAPAPTPVAEPIVARTTTTDALGIKKTVVRTTTGGDSSQTGEPVTDDVKTQPLSSSDPDISAMRAMMYSKPQ